MTYIASFTFKLVLKILLVGIRIQLVVLFDGLKSFKIIEFQPRLFNITPKTIETNQGHE